MDDDQIDAYLARIGVPRPDQPDLHSLRALQRAQQRAVPFENLSIHLGEPITLEEGALFDKIVRRRRGGFCYELNGLFAALLRDLGYSVSLLGARVFDGQQLGPPLDHLALRVELAEPWLVDVGFGSFSELPLRLNSGHEQRDAAGRFQISHTELGETDVAKDGIPQYRLERNPYALKDFEPTCWWQQTSPQSHFTQSLMCSLQTGSGRITLSGTRLIRTTATGRVETQIPERDLPSVYLRQFGFTLDRLPTAPATSG